MKKETKKKLVVVGNGMVTGRFLDELQSAKHSPYDITVISAEPYGSYNRIMLSSVLSGGSNIDSIVQKTPKWYSDHHIMLHHGEAVTHIDGANRTVTTDKQAVIHYDHLVLAMGSRSSTISAANQDIENIFPFRSIADTNQMLEAAKKANNAIIVGGGFLGLEAAWGLAQHGVEVTVIHRGSYILNRQLDRAAATMLQGKLETKGVRFVLDDEIARFNGQTRLEDAVLKSGKTIQTDMAIIATGITPNAELGWEAGLAGDKAIKVDALMQTNNAHISAIGECIEFEGQTFGLVDPLWRHAKVLADRLCSTNKPYPSFENTPIASKLKISGINLYSAGVMNAPDGARELIINDPASNVYRKLIIQNEQLIGIVLFGDVRSGPWYFERMIERSSIQQLMPDLIFGEEFLAA